MLSPREERILEDRLGEIKAKNQELEKQLLELAAKFRDHVDEGSAEARQIHRDLDRLQQICDRLDDRVRKLAPPLPSHRDKAIRPPKEF